MKRNVLAVFVSVLLLSLMLKAPFNLPVAAEQTTEIIYDWFSNYSFPEPGIYVIATNSNPLEMPLDYTMLKEHVTTEASSTDFISILISRGELPTGGYGIRIGSIEKMDYAFVLSANFTNPGPGVVVIQVITNPTALIPIGKLSEGEYSITLGIDMYVFIYSPEGKEVYIAIGHEIWTSTFIIAPPNLAMPEDVNRNGIIDIYDLVTIAIAFGSRLGDPKWNPDADLNGDSVINILDIVTVAVNFGKTA